MKKFLKYSSIVLLIALTGLIAAFWQNDIPLDTLKVKYANSESKFVEVNGMMVHYRDEGLMNDTIPIVLLHGTGASLHTWEGWVSSLKSQKRVITLDLPGYGLTGPDINADYTFDNYNKFLKVFFEKLNVKHLVLGGNSLGGAISWHYTVENQSKVSSLILVDAAGYAVKSKSVPIAFQVAKIPLLKNLFKYVTPKSIIRKSIENVYTDDSKITDALIDRYFELSLRPGNRKAFIDRMGLQPKKAKDASELIKSIKTPTLILWGKDDGLITLEAGQKLHADLPNDTLVIFEKLGHTPMEEDPSITVAAVKSFLKL